MTSYATQVIADWPELTPGQLERIAALLTTPTQHNGPALIRQDSRRPVAETSRGGTYAA